MTLGPKYAPVGNIFLYLTEDCPLRCDYCFVVKKPRRMSSETARKAIDFFFSRHISGHERRLDITFFGGEPFLELERMEEVIAYARQATSDVPRKVSFNATTSGTIFNPQVERIIKDSRMSLLISIDGGADASSHRPFLSGHSSYEIACKNLPRLVSCAQGSVVRMTFHPQALDLVGNVRHTLAMGAPAIALCPVIEANWRGSEKALEDAYTALADWFLAEARRGQIPPLDITNNLLRLHHAALRGQARVGRPCGVGTNLLGIDPDGHVMPCHRFLYRRHDWLGHVDSPILSDERWKYVHLASSDMIGCHDCFAEPVCGGGCPLTALAAGLDLHQPHPAYCLTMRAHVRAVHHIYDTLKQENPTLLETLLRTQPRNQGAFGELLTR